MIRSMFLYSNKFPVSKSTSRSPQLFHLMPLVTFSFQCTCRYLQFFTIYSLKKILCWSAVTFNAYSQEHPQFSNIEIK